MATTYKCSALANELVDRLNVRTGLAALGIVLAVDTDANPYITIGGTATTNRGAIIKVEPVAWPLAQDVLGNTAIPYTPHVIKLLTEASVSGLTSGDLLQIQAQIGAMGTKVELYQSSSGAGLVLADIDTASKLVASYEADSWHALVSAQ